MRIDARDLWGSEAAEDENPELLASFFTYQPTFSDFFDPNVRLLFARGRKGMGKSAMLRQCQYLHSADDATIVVTLTGADLAAQRPITATGAYQHLHDWQQRICAAVNHQIGARVGLALTDDRMLLVESAELAGLRSRNLVSALVERLGRKIGPVGIAKAAPVDHKQLLKRATFDRVWVLIDDIDATFLAREDEVIRISTFFSACRELANSFVGINIRTTVRGDVWSTLRRFDEALDKCEQYMVDVEWSRKSMALLLAGRVRGYLRRYNEEHLLQEEQRTLKGRTDISTEDAVALGVVFEPFFRPKDDTVPPHRMIHMFAGGRPRWAAQLCRLAGREAARVGATRIGWNQMRHILPGYSKSRIDDLVVEHKHQCPALARVVQHFMGAPSVMKLSELIANLEKIASAGPLEIDGTSVTEPSVIAHFLLRIGFLSGMQLDETTGKPAKYYRYDDNPSLLLHRSPVDDQLLWCVTPVYRYALQFD